jgi:1-acyl-sn-glycerol-3-phosphate acyltransferase
MESTNQWRASRGMIFAQALLGIGAYLALALPYLRRVRGLEHLDRTRRYLFVANHVSLLDTILLGALAWRSGHYPILVLGDKKVWHASWLKRALSSRVSFLLERGKLNPRRVRELRDFGRASSEFHLLVFPEGTRGDGVSVAACQPGIYFIAQEARVPIVPLFIHNMQLVSTKTGRFHPFAGWRKVEVDYGEPIAPEIYLSLPREEFTEFVRQRIAVLGPGRLPATSQRGDA